MTPPVTVVPGAAPPVADLAAPVPLAAPISHADLSFQETDSTPSALSRYRRRLRYSGWTSLLVCLCIVTITGAIVYLNWDQIAARTGLPTFAREDPASTNTTTTSTQATSTPQTTNKLTEPISAGIFPRRLLAVRIHNYLYSNSISDGTPDDDEQMSPEQKQAKSDRVVHKVVNRLAEFLHVAPEQVVELSDAAPREIARPPLKPVIESTIAAFLDGCRSQDRIVLLFIGHAVEIGEDCFLVPIEGELADKETLIPLKWLYERLEKCKAQQKVLIMDVCRFNPSRGLERPAGGPMGAKLDAALQNPPAGVQVWSACVAGQYSYEGPNLQAGNTVYTNGYFVNALAEAVTVKKVNPGIQEPNSPLPLEALINGTDTARGVHEGTTFEAGSWYQVKQTPRLNGQLPTETVPYNPAEPLPEKVVIKLPALPDGDPAPRQVVQRILEETEARMTPEGAPLPIRVDTLPLFSAKRLAEYADDGAMTPFRQEILKAAEAVKKYATTFKEDFRGPGGNTEIKRIIMERQKEPARAHLKLMEVRDALLEVKDQRKEEKSKRWQANYDYVLAKLEARIAYGYEYNYMLGQIRKENLPPRDPKFSGYRLASATKIQSGSETRKMVESLRKSLEKLAKAHQGTPWEVLAKRQALNALGLEWKPTP
jgi:hypothetical protein